LLSSYLCSGIRNSGSRSFDTADSAGSRSGKLVTVPKVGTWKCGSGWVAQLKAAMNTAGKEHDMPH
jgi:hypothetical protein